MSLALIVAFVALMIAVIPVAHALVIASGVALLWDGQMPLLLVAQQMFGQTQSFPMLALPFFILAGTLIMEGKLGEELLRFSGEIMQRLRGGALSTTVVGSVVFGGVSGSAVANASALGSVLIPWQKRQGYPAGLCAANNATSAVIDILIPPSIPMILYAVVSGVSIGDLFMAGVLPGILMAAGFVGVCWWQGRRLGMAADATPLDPRRLARLAGLALPALVLPVVAFPVIGLFPVETIDAWNAAFQPLLQAAIAREGDDPNRGANRYYVTLPLHGLWANPEIIDNDVVMAIVSELVGADGVMQQLASDTPMRGSDYQDLHRDTQLLFPETGAESPPYQLAVNFPLVDVTEDNGPMEMAAGTHMLSKAEGLRRVESGETPLTRVLMNRGDVMIRDVRHIHRGTPNPSGQPRPMVVIGYSRRWLFRPEVQIRVPRETLDALPERARRWLRFNPVFDTPEEAAGEAESYRVFAY